MPGRRWVGSGRRQRLDLVELVAVQIEHHVEVAV